MKNIDKIENRRQKTEDRLPMSVFCFFLSSVNRFLFSVFCHLTSDLCFLKKGDTP